VARALNRLGLERLGNLEPKPLIQSYASKRPDDLINIDVKKLVPFRKVGHRISYKKSIAALKSSFTNVFTSPSMTTPDWPYLEVRPDEQQGSAIGFMSRAVAWFNSQGVNCGQIVSDNRLPYI
jgi:hypothetical protein